MRLTRLPEILLPIILSLVFPGTVALAADPICETLYRRLDNPLVEASVELELSLESNVLKILDTTDGKVSGLAGGEPLPESFLKWASSHHPGKDPLEIRWDAIPEDEQMELLQWRTDLRKNIPFYEDRKIPGLVVKKEVDLHFDQPTEFLGKIYPAGDHRVDVSSFLQQRVEYREKNDVEKSLMGVELHFRGRETAGVLSNDAWNLLEGLGVPRNHQHVHITAPLPMASLKANPKIEPYRIADYIRRVNLAMNMLSVLRGGRLETRQKGKEWIFGPMNATTLNGILEYFQKVAAGQSPKIGDSLKKGFVSFRGSDKFDVPGLYGLEHRLIGENEKPGFIRRILDTIQWSMNHEKYGVSQAEIERWLAKKPWNVQSEQYFRKTWYDRSWDELLSDAPLEVKKLFAKDGVVGSSISPMHPFAKDLIAVSEVAGEVKMLFHNWANDPVLLGDPELLKSILDAQVDAIQKLKSGAAFDRTMQGFLKKSGLFKRIWDSVQFGP